MLRKPQPGDFIPRDLIKDKETLDALHALAKNQNPPHGPYGQWDTKRHWEALVYATGGYWAWRNMEINSSPKETSFTACTPEDFLGPDHITPGSWVEVYTDGINAWHKRWFVGYDEAGCPVTTVANGNPTLWPRSTPIRPHRSKVQKALDKLQEEHIVTKEMTRTVQLLDTLGLLKE